MSVESAARVLNELLELDPLGANRLFSYRVECSEGVVGHPSIVCDQQTVGLLGVINGILRADNPSGSGVAACWDEGRLVGFRVVAWAG